MADPFPYSELNVLAGVSKAVAVTPSDSTVLDTTRGLYVGGAGNLAVRMRDGTTITYSSIVAGSILPFRVDKVMSTNTTATSIVALY